MYKFLVCIRIILNNFFTFIKGIFLLLKITFMIFFLIVHKILLIKCFYIYRNFIKIYIVYLLFT